MASATGIQAYSPQLDKRCRRYLRPIIHAWRVDEVYVKVKSKVKVFI